MILPSIELVIKYGAYGLILVLCIVIFVLVRWVIGNHIHGLSEQIEKIDGKITGIGNSLDAEKKKREEKDEEQGKELVGIQKDIEYMGKDIKRIDDKIGKYLNGR